jgi:hypothetical protein
MQLKVEERDEVICIVSDDPSRGLPDQWLYAKMCTGNTVHDRKLADDIVASFNAPKKDEVIDKILEDLGDRHNYDAIIKARASLIAFKRVLSAIKYHHGQKGGDRCFLDINRIYTAAGLPPGDFKVGNKFEMAKECLNFIDKDCINGGFWTSNAELTETIVRLRTDLDGMKRELVEADLKKAQLETKLSNLASWEPTKVSEQIQGLDRQLRQVSTAYNEVRAKLTEAEKTNNGLRENLIELKQSEIRESDKARVLSNRLGMLRRNLLKCFDDLDRVTGNIKECVT